MSRLLAVLLATVLCGSACSQSQPESSAPSPAKSSGAAHHSGSPTGDPRKQLTLDERAGEFDQLLGMHTILVIRFMRSVVVATPSGEVRAHSVLQQNSERLSKHIGEVYGSERGAEYKKLWDGHIASLFAYANGILSKNKEARTKAYDSLVQYCAAYGSWLSGVTVGRLPAKETSAGVRVHVDDLISQIDAYSAGDYATAYRIERMAYEHMFSAGTGLVAGSVRPEQAIALQSPAARFRNSLAMLLGEHMQLVIDAQRAIFAGSSEFAAAATQVNANTTAIVSAIGAVAGPSNADKFSSAWAGHVEALIAYARAVATHEEVARAAVGKQLAMYADRLGALLSGLVQNQIAADAVVDALTTHDTHLIQQVDAYAAKNYTRSDRLAVDGYEQILAVAMLLAGAIEKTVRSGMPVGAAGTGGGSTAVARR